MHLDDSLRSVRIGETRVDILGTAHVSRVSCEQVTCLLGGGDYDAVAVELCDRRHRAICDPESIEHLDLWQAIRKNRLGATAAMVALGAYQQRLADSVGVDLGGEMKAAVALADKNGLPLTLMDRDIGTTLRRLYCKVAWWRRAMLVNSLIYSLFTRQKISLAHVEEMKNSDVLTGMFQELQAVDPYLHEVLVNERDRYMSANIFTYVHREKPTRVLAVVGAGHLPGMVDGLQSYLEDGTLDPHADIDRLDQVPPRSKWPKFVPWIVVGIILAGFVAGFSQGGALGRELVFDWILINGGLAALGATFAGAHPLTILTAFVSAPLTSINPTIGAGMVAAAAELYLRKPLVEDFKNLRQDTTNWPGWWRNRIARTLLVFLFTSAGSAVGTYIGGFHIYDSL